MSPLLLLLSLTHDPALLNELAEMLLEWECEARA
jgi:hypothetical protein